MSKEWNLVTRVAIFSKFSYNGDGGVPKWVVQWPIRALWQLVLFEQTARRLSEAELTSKMPTFSSWSRFKKVQWYFSKSLIIFLTDIWICSKESCTLPDAKNHIFQVQEYNCMSHGPWEEYAYSLYIDCIYINMNNQTDSKYKSTRSNTIFCGTRG